MQSKELVSGAVHLFSLPDIYLKISEMVSDPNSSAADLGRYISKDPSLTAKLLKIANSPFYGFPSKINTVSRAVTVIGGTGLRDLALAMSTINTVSKVPMDGFDLRKYWRHSLFCAVTARLLAGKCNTIHSEPYFVAGLLHDIGKLVMMSKLPGKTMESIQKCKMAGTKSSDIEKPIFGFDHTMVGGELLRLWNLPEDIIEAVEFHHDPFMANKSPMSAAIIHIADVVTNAVVTPESIEKGGIDYDPYALEVTGLSIEVIATIIDEAKDQFNISVDLFLSKAA